MTDDDVEHFRRSMSDARPLKSDARVPEPKKKPPARARFSRADEQKALAESLEADIDTMEAANAESMRYHRPHVGKRTMRKLARGKYAVQAEIDLHGMTVAEARPRLSDFIDYSLKQGLTCVRIVHGKGLRSGPGGPVIKRRIGRWLRRRDDVLAFCSARPAHGGTGALYVLLGP